MSCCNKKTLKICEPIGTCDEDILKLPYSDLADGTYSVWLSFLGSLLKIDITAAGGTLELPTKDLNEDYFFTGIVVNTDGEAVLFTNDGEEYDSFSFQTKIIHHVE